MVLVRFYEFILLILVIIISGHFFLPSIIVKWSKGLVIGWGSGFGFLVLFLHILFEGIRWQMVLIYLISIVTFGWGIYKLIKWYRNPPSDTKIQKPIRKVKGIVSICIVLLVVASTLFISSQFPLFTIPKPSGSYDIGTTSFLLTDSNRDEIFTDDVGDSRRIVIKVWYPTDEPEGSPVRYVDTPAQFGKGEERSFGFPSFVVSHFSLISTHSYLNAPISTNYNNYPVIIFSHGYGGVDFQNTVLMEELASNGYIVFSINHVYESIFALFSDENGTRLEAYEELEYPPGHQINDSLHIWANDTEFLIDQLEIPNNPNIPSLVRGSVDMGKIGVMGHSFGGTTAEEMILIDSRVQVGISMDSPHIGNSLKSNITKPFMLMFGRDYGNPELNDSVFLRAENDCYGLFIEGADHYNFADLNIWTPFLQTIGYAGPIDGYRMLSIMNDYILAFFDEYLYGTTSSLLDGPSTDYPEVSFYSRNV
ncbi:MAG: alpha/beta hydrolase family protein [Candidatus Kariarchaeaceae archaeon]|jgi:predicted dienelactone hydrolase